MNTLLLKLFYAGAQKAFPGCETATLIICLRTLSGHAKRGGIIGEHRVSRYTSRYRGVIGAVVPTCS